VSRKQIVPLNYASLAALDVQMLYVHAPRLGAQGRRPRRRKKIWPSDRDRMATDKSESCYFRVLNKIYLQNLLHGWVVNHEPNLISRLNS